MLVLLVLGCGNDIASNHQASKTSFTNQRTQHSNKEEQGSWQYFLQHLPMKDAPILDYRGRPVADQEKHVAVLNYDVGHSDLQQCADALMRLRAEYLFQEKRYDEIGFHFVNGSYYSWKSFCRGQRPVASGNSVHFVQGKNSDYIHESLREYLDLVYAYASTISLARELKPADDFDIGTVVIHPGSPGHCFIIIDKASDGNGNTRFKLAEGYTPAQSIYVLRNLDESGKNPWYYLKKGIIETASYRFSDYQLKKFE